MKRSAFITISLSAGLAILSGTGLWSQKVNAEINIEPPVRRALLIGVGKYESDRFPSLEYPQNDVARLKELLGSPHYGFRVTILSDDENCDLDPAIKDCKPTRDNILKAIQKYLIDDANPGDFDLFYYSGHGSSVKNRQSDEKDRRDETIVPSDAVRPVHTRQEFKDIRDKEIAELFNKIIDKNIKLTAIFDSCHSGSIARGEEQTKEIDGVDSFDFDEKPPKCTPEDHRNCKPEERGALILTAAEDYQQASGGVYELNGRLAKYSHFTAQLLQSLYESPADRQAVRDLFRRVTSKLVAAGRAQTPTIAGIRPRLDETLFGTQATNTGRTFASITFDQSNGPKRLVVAAGLADGLADGVKMRRIVRSTGKETDPKLTIRITKTGFGLSEFEVVGPNDIGIVPTSVKELGLDDYFEQATWVAKRESDVAVWLPPAWLSEQQLKMAVTELRRQITSTAFELVDEPNLKGGQNIIFAEGAAGKTEWKLRTEKGSIVSLGPRPSAAVVARALPQGRGAKPKVFINLPPTIELRQAAAAAFGSNSSVVMAVKREMALYELVGRVNDRSALEYSWLLKSAMQNGAVRDTGNTTLPPLTDWVNGRTDSDVALSLKNLGERLAKIRGWLSLPSPIAVGSPEFPYRFEIRPRNKPSKKIIESGDTMYGDWEYDMFLVATPESLKDNTRLLSEFWVYILDIDVNGNGTYLDITGGSERYAGLSFDPLDPPTEIPLMPKEGNPLEIRTPYGSDTFIVIVTDRSIDRTRLQFAGVRDQEGNQKSGDSNPLDGLLKDMGVDVTSRGYSTPDKWSVQKIIVKSSAKDPIATVAKRP
jgi:hypothetical protein